MAWTQAQQWRPHSKSRLKVLLLDVNVLRRAAGLREALGSFDEEVSEASAEVK
jgi:hypothetical protein